MYRGRMVISLRQILYQNRLPISMTRVPDIQTLYWRLSNSNNFTSPVDLLTNTSTASTMSSSLCATHSTTTYVC